MIFKKEKRKEMKDIIEKLLQEKIISVKEAYLLMTSTWCEEIEALVDILFRNQSLTSTEVICILEELKNRKEKSTKPTDISGINSSINIPTVQPNTGDPIIPSHIPWLQPVIYCSTNPVK